jgi:hypothetical protein
MLVDAKLDVQTSESSWCCLGFLGGVYAVYGGHKLGETSYSGGWLPAHTYFCMVCRVGELFARIKRQWELNC